MQNLDKVEKADNIGAYLLRLTGNAIHDHYRAARHELTTQTVLPTECAEENSRSCTTSGNTHDISSSINAGFAEPTQQALNLNSPVPDPIFYFLAKSLFSIA